MELVTSDLASQENVAPLTMTAFGWWRKDVPIEVSYRYWRDVHGVQAARIPGFYQYRQLHLASNRNDLLPIVNGIDYNIPTADQPNGIAQELFLSEEDRQTFVSSPFVTKDIFEDEQNLCERNASQWSEGDHARTYVDRTGEATPQGEPSLPTFALCFKQTEGSSVGDFHRHMMEQVAQPWSQQDSVMRLRLQLLNPYDDKAWNSPGVKHDWAVEKRYQAWIELVLRNESFAQQPFTSSNKEEHSRFIQAIHTFPVFAKYTIVYNGKPTDVGLRGYPAVQTIEQAGADNQKAINLLEAMYGAVVHGAK